MYVHEEASFWLKMVGGRRRENGVRRVRMEMEMRRKMVVASGLEHELEGAGMQDEVEVWGMCCGGDDEVGIAGDVKASWGQAERRGVN
jgi:hypothetical protein